ncbi:TonB-dependent receptor [Pseudoduganella albidiflava]|uniref:TonB-dependent receptor n=1 Tax=Pseudoduganella albidiflava TaxID=321983 RepID=A0A411X664_9BURK|nr:TonB-dependent receptor [Pseudoduganella albidiflava]QBI04315.1 TonB-dependent receptor [Pseudoduganella albidiflava]GGY26276.1 TonB-dependent receptor [Pseudoduganella albidiflava]
MNFTNQPGRRHAIAIAAAICAMPALAQTTDTPAAPAAPSAETQQVVVTGMRASLQKAQDLKKNADQVVDSIVADDIGKLPDSNVAEALQRITGVQISRSRGEGDRVQIRGLSQTQTLVNGRSIFTAGKERGLSFQDVPSELLAGADVYKSPTAEQVEGGIGGVIDLRMRRPFDFAGLKVAGTVKATDADYADKRNGEGSLLVSNRWKLNGQDFGALISIAHQKRNYRSDMQELDPPSQLADGSGAYAPIGAWYSYEMGERERTGINSSLQWRPMRGVELYLDANYTKLESTTDTYGFYGSPYWPNWTAETNSGAMWPRGSVTTENGNVTKGTFYGADLTTSGYIGDNDTKTRQLAIGGSWRANGWTVKSELGYTKSNFERFYQEVRLGVGTSSPAFTYDLTTELPSAYPELANPNDLVTPSQYWASKALYFRQKNEGRETTWRGDVERNLDSDLIPRIKAGVRLTDRKASSSEINTIDDIWNAGGTGPVGGALPGLASQIGTIPYSDLLHREGAGTIPKQWLSIANLDWLRDPQTVRSALGLAVPAFDAGQTFDFGEKTQALYGMADFESELLGKEVTGNFGVRYVRTKTERRWQELQNNGYVTRQADTTDDDFLPSVNARMELTDKLIARVAASKVVTRPDFNQLTPSLSLDANNRTGFVGNPDLQPLSARQFDTTLEYYLSQSDYVFAAAFYKKVDGFIQTTTSDVKYGDTTYAVRTPSNGNDGTIKGLEIGYQGFFTNLPGYWKGLGLQANFTYVHSKAPGPLEGQQTALENLSKQSYNIVGMYDWNDFALRLAYNYRGKYLAGTENYYVNNGATMSQTPAYMNGYGLVDAYASYQLTKNLKVAFEVSNLTRKSRSSYYGVTGTQFGRYADDRRFGLSLQANL